jgi:short-subunit dehydrogenase
MRDLRDKVAVITGAAEGIGRAITARAAQNGMRLVLADINAEKLAQFSDELTASGVLVHAETVDVSKAAQVQRLADAAFERFGNVHLLVNNAGVGLAKPVWETTERDWEWVTGVNLYGVTNALRSFLPRMMEAGEPGHVVNVASIAGLISSSGLAAYNATKFAVVTISEGLYHDLALRGARIGVSVLCPAWVKTRIAESERNRDPGDRSDPAKLDEHTRKTGLAVFEAVQAGMAPDDVAIAVFSAIENDRFYILTREETRAAVQIRMTDILENRAPTRLKF